MSGGSWDYICFRVRDVAEDLISSEDVYRRALGSHLLDVYQALYDIEWVDSGDKMPGAERESIKKVIGKIGVDEYLLESSIERAEKVKEELEEILNELGDKRKTNQRAS